ncbi:hypothetical protein BASA50_002870 [Batrachochytrium salamandrivorans]|uniref:Timeless N-terminal domain-containing protein n=1 Tax=Batrachochytrium salamandrivorans TaxID=1357716 RepID=A0ABQ8FN38_9FUNG|nr:hypothetical protein BASA50_002870 [Batrachochytrium salamandrivorans]
MIQLASFQRDGVQAMRECRALLSGHSMTLGTSAECDAELGAAEAAPQPHTLPKDQAHRFSHKHQLAKGFKGQQSKFPLVSKRLSHPSGVRSSQRRKRGLLLPSSSRTPQLWDTDADISVSGEGQGLKSLHLGMYTKLSSELPRHASVIREDKSSSGSSHRTQSVTTNSSIPVDMKSELVIHISVFNPKRPSTRIASVKVLGSQTLANLRDALPCVSDIISVDSDEQDRAIKPGYFLIENSFYVDIRSGTMDCSGLFNPNVDSGHRQDYPFQTLSPNLCQPKCYVLHFTIFSRAIYFLQMIEIDEHFDNHVLSVCAALGGYESSDKSAEPTYIPGDESIACLRDLKRFLRTAEQTDDRHVHSLLCKWQVLQNDLIPLLITSVQTNDLKMAVTVCELLVPLTWPYNKEGQLKYQDEIKGYQEAFLKEGVLSSVLAVLVHLFSSPYKKRAENDHARLRLFFSLFRNLLAASDVQVASTASAERQWRSVHQERLIIRLESEGIIELLLSICGSLSSDEFEGWNTLITEIVYLMFFRRDISELLEQKPRGGQLADLLKQEQSSKAAFSKPKLTRHSRFGGTLSISLPNGAKVNTRNMSNKSVLLEDIPSSASRSKKGTALSHNINSMVPIEGPKARTLFCGIATRFICGSFNDLAVSMKRDFDREKATLKEIDNIRYIWLCQFALSFRRLSSSAGNPIEVESVLGILTTPNLIFTIRRLSASRDNKNPAETTQCLRLLDELLLVVEELSKSSDDRMCDLAAQLINALYYEHDNVLLLRSLCKDTRHHSKSYLEALVACIDTLISVTERNTAAKGFLITRRRSRKAPKRDPSSVINGSEEHESMQGDSDTENVQQQCSYTENIFDFKAYVAGFASESTVTTYCKLLSYYPDLSHSVTRKILNMFKLLFNDQGHREPFYKLSVLVLLNRVVLAQSHSKADGLGKELEEFLKLVSGTLVQKIMSDKERGPLELLKIVFSFTNSDRELSISPEDNFEALEDVVDNTGFSIAAFEYWKGTAMRHDIKELLFQDLHSAFIAMLQKEDSPTLSDSTQKLIQTSDEIQHLFKASNLSVDIDRSSLILSVEWSTDDLQSAIQTIGILKGQKRRADSRITTSRKKASTSEPPAFLSAQFVDDSDEDLGSSSAFFEREATLRQQSELAWEKQKLLE